MATQNLCIILLVILGFSSVFCQNSSHETSNQEDNAVGTDHRQVVLSSNSRHGTPEAVKISGVVVALIVLAVIVFWVICRCVRGCGRQPTYSGRILPNVSQQPTAGVQIEQSISVQHAPPPVEENQHRMQQPKFQPMQQFPPHNQPMQQFPPQYQPMPQFPPYDNPIQQFSPHDSPMQQFSSHNSPMQQFSPQNQPMQQFSAQHSPLQQFQHSGTTSQFQYSPTAHQFSNYPEPPPAYAEPLPPKY